MALGPAIAALYNIAMTKPAITAVSSSPGFARRLAHIGGRVALSAWRLRFRIGSRLHAARAVSRACDLFCTPLPQARRRASTADMQDAARGRLRVNGLDLATYRWGDPCAEPWVLLVHGWSSCASAFLPWVERLRRSGYAVVAFDQPAHGLSEGRRADLPAFVQAVHAVAGLHGKPAALIGHSLGGAAVAVAMSEGLRTERAILISPAADLAAAIQRFTRLMRLPDVFGARMVAAFEAGPVPIDALQAHRIAPRIEGEGLIVHDSEDREIPVEEGQRYASSWRGARMMTTRGLGHSRILADDQVIAAALSFLAEETGSDSRIA
jgi:pimeloyl-ACP methyl ester carboxylesterase